MPHANTPARSSRILADLAPADETRQRRLPIPDRLDPLAPRGAVSLPRCGSGPASPGSRRRHRPDVRRAARERRSDPAAATLLAARWLFVAGTLRGDDGRRRRTLGRSSRCPSGSSSHRSSGTRRSALSATSRSATSSTIRPSDGPSKLGCSSGGVRSSPRGRGDRSGAAGPPDEARSVRTSRGLGGEPARLGGVPWRTPPTSSRTTEGLVIVAASASTPRTNRYGSAAPDPSAPGPRSPTTGPRSAPCTSTTGPTSPRTSPQPRACGSPFLSGPCSAGNRQSRSQPITLMSGAPGAGKSHTVDAMACDAVAGPARARGGDRRDRRRAARPVRTDSEPEPVVFGSNERSEGTRRPARGRPARAPRRRGGRCGAPRPGRANETPAALDRGGSSAAEDADAGPGSSRT